MTDTGATTPVKLLRRRRGVIAGSITRLNTRLRELQDTRTATPEQARLFLAKLNGLDAEYRELHMQVIDKTEDDHRLEAEQDTLDKHDDVVASLTSRLQHVIDAGAAPTPAAAADPRERRLVTLKLTRLETCLEETKATISALTVDTSELSLLQQHQEQLLDYKRDVATTYDRVVALEPEPDDELLGRHTRVKKLLFDCSHLVKRLLNAQSGTVLSTPTSTKGTKLPKLEVPVFDGNILRWTQFWEQFCTSVHERSDLTDAEKLVYLQNSIKDGSAKNAIDGLSQGGEHYAEAIACLKSRFDRPRLIHQTHVRTILEVPPMREGNAKELRHLHDIVTQHLRALKSMAYDPSGPFITSMLELKLDATTLFEWQRHTQSQTDVPHYQELLTFLDLRAQASEGSTASATNRKHKSDYQPGKRGSTGWKGVTAFTTSHDMVSTLCVMCPTEKHPLYLCPKFKLLSHERKMSLLKSNDICMNCLSSGHFVRQCKSAHKCRKCQRMHHTLLHLDKQPEDKPARNELPNESPKVKVPSHTVVGLKQSTLLMTCRILVFTPDGSSVEARALLDNASSASFVSERLVQSACLPCTRQSVRVSGIGAMSHDSPIQYVSNFQISAISTSSKRIDVTALVIRTRSPANYPYILFPLT